MTVLQIAMTDENYEYAKKLLIMAQGSYQLDGNKYTMGKTIIKVLEEWSRSKDFIKETKQEREDNLTLTLFKNNPTEVQEALDLIQFVERMPGEGNTKALYDLILRLEPYWVAPVDHQTKFLIAKMKELLQ